MSEVGVRELRTKASEVIRRVRDDGETFDVTYRGRVVARISPVDSPRIMSDESAVAWSDLKLLSEEIGARWPEGVSAVEVVPDVRRDL